MNHLCVECELLANCMVATCDCVWITFLLFSAGPRFVVPFGDKLVDYNEHFRLFLSTRNPTPNLPPYATALVNEVNFTITRAGLTAQVGYGIQC